MRRAVYLMRVFDACVCVPLSLFSPQRRKDKLSVGPALLGFFVFVIVGSSLLQVIRTAGSKGPFG